MTAAQAEARIRDWYERGLVLYTDLETLSTRTLRVCCPECRHGVRVLPAARQCVSRSWEQWGKP